MAERLTDAAKRLGVRWQAKRDTAFASDWNRSKRRERRPVASCSLLPSVDDRSSKAPSSLRFRGCVRARQRDGGWKGWNNG
jgi:hypothetical protein